MLKKVKGFLIFGLIFLYSVVGSSAVLSRVSNIGNSSSQPDGLAPGGDRENSYAWCMDVLSQPDGEYLYVGCNRNLIYNVLSIAGFNQGQIEELFQGDIGVATNNQGRVFRYKLDGTKQWEEVYRGASAYRGAKTYTDSEGETALYMVTTYMGSGITPGGKVIKFPSEFNPETDAPTVVMRLNEMDALGEGPLRAITVYNGNLVIGTFTNNIYITNLPEEQGEGDDTSLEGWTQIASEEDFSDDENFSKANILWQVLSFNNYLYAFLAGGPAGQGGFSVYKGSQNQKNDGWNWQPIVGSVDGARYPSGMGDLYNNATSTGIFKDYVYVGSMTEMHLSIILGQFDTNNVKGAQLYRFDKDDNWELIIGDLDRNPLFEKRLGNYGAGFFNQSLKQKLLLRGTVLEDKNFSLNQYIWWLEEHKGKLYLTTFDIRIFIKYLSPQLLEKLGYSPDEANRFYETIKGLQAVLENDAGFDIYVSSDGIKWSPVTTDGFEDQYNYGGRVLKSTSEGLFVGTSNPFYGCQVWKVDEVSGGGDNCFIATAAFGSPFAPYVKILREFRDKYLLTNKVGRAFVRKYYAKSPAVASVIKGQPILMFLTRCMLIPFIFVAYLTLKGLFLPLLFALYFIIWWKEKNVSIKSI